MRAAFFGCGASMWSQECAEGFMCVSNCQRSWISLCRGVRAAQLVHVALPNLTKAFVSNCIAAQTLTAFAFISAF